MTNRFTIISDEELIKVASSATSIKDVLKKFSLPVNGTSSTVISERLDALKFDKSILRINKKKAFRVYKVCPVCGKHFSYQRAERNKTCCSRACANTYFRSGENNPNYKGNRYTQLCFKHHKHECIICGEANVVAVHHYDNNHYNDAIENLVPLCPTHHTYMHSKHINLIKDKVDKYVKDFKQSQSMA